MRFASLAARAGISESGLAMIAIRSVLNPDAKSLWDTEPEPALGPATDRITIRLRPGDGLSIARRAAQRGMKPSAYIAALVRAHVAANPPWPANELAALKQSVAVLGSLGRLIAQSAKTSAGISRDVLDQSAPRLVDVQPGADDAIGDNGAGDHGDIRPRRENPLDFGEVIRRGQEVVVEKLDDVEVVEAPDDRVTLAGQTARPDNEFDRRPGRYAGHIVRRGGTHNEAVRGPRLARQFLQDGA